MHVAIGKKQTEPDIVKGRRLHHLNRVVAREDDYEAAFKVGVTVEVDI